MNLQEMYNNAGISKEVFEFCTKTEEGLRERFDEIDSVSEYNQLKVLTAM